MPSHVLFSLTLTSSHTLLLVTRTTPIAVTSGITYPNLSAVCAPPIQYLTIYIPTQCCGHFSPVCKLTKTLLCLNPKIVLRQKLHSTIYHSHENKRLTVIGRTTHPVEPAPPNPLLHRLHLLQGSPLPPYSWNNFGLTHRLSTNLDTYRKHSSGTSTFQVSPQWTTSLY